jgi:hypothetical protein
MPNEIADADVVELIGNQTITNMVKDVRSLWKEGQDNRLKLGEKFSLLYHEVERYRKSKTGLTYASAVARTGVPRATAERYRQMWEVKEQHSIPADVFLLLCEEGANLAVVKVKMGEAFKGAISSLLPRIKSLDTTDPAAIEVLAEEVNKLIPAPAEDSADLAKLTEQLAEQVKELPKASSDEQAVEIAEAVRETKQQISAFYVERMKPLVAALGPFINWSDKEIKNYHKKFLEQPLSEQRRLYKEASKFAQTAVAGLAITSKAAA